MHGAAGPAINRRAVLALLPAGLLAACSGLDATPSMTSPARTAARSSAPTAGPAHTSATSTRPVAVAQATTPATSVPPRGGRVVDPLAVADRFADERPTQWGTAMPGITQTVAVRDEPTLALTFDACGGPGGSGYDADIIRLLRSHEVPATLFLNARWIRANRSIAHDLMDDPLFAIGNHGTRHVPLSVTGRSAYGIPGTRSAAQVVEEVRGDEELLALLMGKAPIWFRTGTAWYDDVAVDITRALGMQIAGFAVNADAGATASAQQVGDNLRTAPSGSIVLMHLNHPGSGTFPGLRDALPRLIDQGTQFVHLA